MNKHCLTCTHFKFNEHARHVNRQWFCDKTWDHFECVRDRDYSQKYVDVRLFKAVINMLCKYMFGADVIKKEKVDKDYRRVNHIMEKLEKPK